MKTLCNKKSILSFTFSNTTSLPYDDNPLLIETIVKISHPVVVFLMKLSIFCSILNKCKQMSNVSFKVKY